MDRYDLPKNLIVYDNGRYIFHEDHLKTIAEKDREIESLRTKITDLEIDADRFPTLAEFSNLQDENADLKSELKDLRLDIGGYLMCISRKTDEIKRLREALTEILEYPEERASYDIAEEAMKDGL